MSVPANKAALDKLQKIVEENDEAGDWLYSSIPGSAIPIPVDRKLTPEELIDLTGDTRLPPKK